MTIRSVPGDAPEKVMTPGIPVVRQAIMDLVIVLSYPPAWPRKAKEMIDQGWPWRLRPWYWNYVFAKNTGLVNIICRILNHPHGYQWYSSTYSPDYHCKDCGELLDG